MGIEEIYNVACVNCGETEYTVILKPDTLHRYICPKCKNATYVYITKNREIIMFRQDELCTECNGTGKCPICRGSGGGIFPCEKCGGTGICPRCRGLRHVPRIVRGEK